MSNARSPDFSWLFATGVKLVNAIEMRTIQTNHQIKCIPKKDQVVSCSIVPSWSDPIGERPRVPQRILRHG